MYRHSKWLAFMERRLLLAKELLNPVDSALIVAIDEKEYLRLGLLLGQVFPDGNITMISSVTNPAGAGRTSDFSRTDEYLYFIRFGKSAVLPEQRDLENVPVVWDTLRRSSLAGRRGNRGPGACGPNQFFPIYVDQATGRIADIGEPLPESVPVEQAPARDGCVTVLPIRPNGIEMNWGITPEIARQRLSDGHLRAGKFTADAPQAYVISYLTAGIVRDIASGKAVVTGRNEDGSVIAFYPTGREKMPTTNWNRPAHDAQRYGTEVLKAILGGRSFPYPKSLYAVEDCLRMFLAKKPNATVVDFFSGSGTTTHAVMRLNKQDGGRRRSIGVTNNEVSADEQKRLRASGFRPGDPEWEQWGICEYITKPRIRAAITGRTPNGDPIKGEYKFTDAFPMSDGFDENVEFFTLTYESAMRVQANREFARIAPLLWLRAGSKGRRIESLPNGWDVADTYGVIEDMDHADSFIEAMIANPHARLAFIVTDEDRFFEAIARAIPEGVETVRLYDSYLRNFEIDALRGER
jgi:adenine-specific DNA-methyltransferase